MSRTMCLACFAGAALAGLANAQTSTDVNRAYANEMIADADSRASGLADAGYDNGFVINSADGNNQLRINGMTQFRYYLNFRDTPSNSTDEDFTNGFEQHDTRLVFSGHVLNPNLNFKIEGAFTNEGNFGLLDAYGTYQLDNGMKIWFGQFKAPTTREWLVSDFSQLAIDRSMVNEVFNPGYTQGIALSYQAEQWRGVVSFNDGARTGNTPFTSPAEADFALTARGEWMWAGQWERFDDFTSWRNSDGYAGMVGAAVHWQTGGGTGPGNPSDLDVFQYTADVSFEGNGWNVFAEFVGQTTDPENQDSFNDFGFVVQGGLFVTDQAELFARWDSVLPDDERTVDDAFNTITAGVNYYFIPESQSAKLSGDIQYFIDEPNDLVAALGSDSNTGFVQTTEDSEFAVRFQMQLTF
ncbi:MAG: porin [Phycisphaerales bacterium]|nr:porin [Phycisphaerales bacterium]